GLGRVAALELPRTWGGLIDLPEVMDEQAARRLAAVLAGREDQVAVRASGVFGRRLVHDPRGQEAGNWQLSGTVLITGGTGALGAHAARWAAGAGARHVVLASPRDPDAPGATELRDELGSLGAQVTVTACDVADRDTLAAVLAAIPDLTAVVHAAGVGIDDAKLWLLSAEQLDGVLRATMTPA